MQSVNVRRDPCVSQRNKGRQRFTRSLAALNSFASWLKCSLGGGYAGFAFLSTAIQRKRSHGHLLSVAEPHTRFDGEMMIQTELLEKLERGCFAQAASGVDHNGVPTLEKVGRCDRSQCHINETNS